jgi:hypothetical protein
VRSVPKCYKQEKSTVQLVVRQSPGGKGMNTEVEGPTALKTVTRQRVVKTRQTEKT